MCICITHSKSHLEYQCLPSFQLSEVEWMFMLVQDDLKLLD